MGDVVHLPAAEAAHPPAPLDPGSVTAPTGPGVTVATPRGWAQRAWPLGLYSVVAIFLCNRAWFAGAPRIIGVSHNPASKVWFLAWYPFALGHGWQPFVTRWLTYPHPANLMWNNSVPVLALALTPVTLLVGPTVAYNLAMTASLMAAAATAYWALSGIVRTQRAAVIGGAVFGFSPFILAEASTGHLPWASLWTLPLLLILIDRAVLRPRGSPVWVGLWGGLWAVVQFGLAEEVLLDATLLTGLVLVGLALAHPAQARARLHRGAVALATAVAVFVPLIAVPLAVEFLGPSGQLGGAVMSPRLNSADLLAFLVPTPLQMLAPAGAVHLSNRFTGYPYDRIAYLGLPLLLCAIGVGRWRWTDPWVRGSLVAFGAILLLALGGQLHVGGRILPVPLPWALIGHLPLFRKVLPSRLVAFAWLAAALVVALALDHVWRLRMHRARVAGWALALLVLLPLVPASALVARPTQLPGGLTATAVARVPVGSVALVLPAVGASPCASTLWQAMGGMRYRSPWGCILHPGVNGAPTEDPYRSALSVAVAAAQGGRTVPITARALRTWRADVRRWRVDFVAVTDRTPHRLAVVRLFTAILGRGPARTGGASVWFNLLPGGRPPSLAP